MRGEDDSQAAPPRQPVLHPRPGEQLPSCGQPTWACCLALDCQELSCQVSAGDRFWSFQRVLILLTKTSSSPLLPALPQALTEHTGRSPCWPLGNGGEHGGQGSRLHASWGDKEELGVAWS